MAESSKIQKDRLLLVAILLPSSSSSDEDIYEVTKERIPRSKINNFVENVRNFSDEEMTNIFQKIVHHYEQWNPEVYFEYKSWKIMMWIEVFILQMVNIIGIVYISSSKQCFMQYIPTIMGQQLVVNYVVVYRTEISKKYRQMSALLDLHAWSLDSAGIEIRQKLLDERNILGMTCTLLTAVLLASVVIFISPLFGDEEEIFLTHKFIKIVFKEWSNVALIISVVLFLFLTCHMPMCFWTICKTATDLKHQIALLNEYIKKNLVDVEGDYDDDQYQNMVHNRLVIIIKRHNVVRKLCKTFEESVRLLIVPLITNVVISNSFLIYFVLTQVDIRSDLRFLTPAGIGFIGFCLNIHEIVSISDEEFKYLAGFASGWFIIIRHSNPFYRWDKIPVIGYECPWYNWSITNRKILILFLTGGNIPFKWSVFDAQVDHAVITEIAKMSYTILMGLWNITHRIKK